ncbi:MAG: heavy-metal-associated domain-containing protein [Deinococcus sp.]|nr:heavy-metal-associated domain-containing protein [Deinococcus sp.]
MNRVLLGVRGVEKPEQTEKILAALRKVAGVSSVSSQTPGEVEIEYDENELTVMDLIRAVHQHGFLAGML